MKFKPVKIKTANGQEVLIREARIDEAGELITTVKTFLGDSDYLLMNKEEFNPTVEDEIRWLQSFSKNPNSLFIIAVANGKIVATSDITSGNVQKIAHTASIGISIISEYRGMGLGTVMMQTAIDWAKRKTNLEILWLNVFAANEPAIHIYKKLGFVIEGRQKDYFKLLSGTYHDNLTMTLDLRNKKI